MKTRVLMLGWEFPPLISGGLGQATLGLSMSLAKLAEVTVIVPKAEDTNFPPPSSVINLSQFSKIDFKEEIAMPFTTAMAKKIQSVSPYSTYDSQEIAQVEAYLSKTIRNGKKVKEEKRSVLQELEAARVEMQIEEAYGNTLLDQIIIYSKLAVQQALQQEFDLIHAHDWITFIAAIELKKLTGKPLVVHIHSLEYDRVGPNSKGWVYELEKYAMEEADLVIPVSHYTSEIITYRYGIDEAKVVAIHNGVESITPYRKEKGFPEKLIVFLGRITPQKGPQIFLRLARELLKGPHHLRFVITGEGEMKRILMEEVARFGLGNKIHFTGFLEREGIYDLLAMADIVVMPSRSEPFGLVALEAATFGVPVIISQYSGVIEVLKHAPKIEPSEVLQIKGYIHRLLNDESYYQRLVQNLKQDVEGLTWDVAAQKVVEAYQRIL